MSLEDQDHRALWHPFTPMRHWLAETPLVIDRAEGNELIDIHGNRYLDGVASLWVNVHGHRHPHINAAIAAQLDRVSHTTLLGLASTPSIVLAEALISRAPPGLARVFFSDSGSAAVEVALKIAFQYQQLRNMTRRTKFLALTDAYHGDTLGSVSVGGIDVFHRIFHPLLFQTLRAPPEIVALEKTIERHVDELCAVVLEPLVQGAAGIRLMPPGLLAAAARLCRRHGLLLIADEVATGFGRTGTLFACEQEGVTPDLLACAKGLSGGYLPLSATLATEEVFSTFLGAPHDRLTFFHGHSFAGNPLACAAAIASLELFDRERTLENLPAKIAALQTELARKVAPLPHVAEVRQKGVMVGIELRRDRTTPFAPQDAIGARVCQLVRKRGVILRPLGPVVVLMPPLSIRPDEITRLVDATAAAITEATTPVSTNGPIWSPGPGKRGAVRQPQPRGLFVCGTDTAVGKTVVAAALLRLALRRGFQPTPYKPVETGCASDPADAMALRHAAQRQEIPIATVCPYAFGPPVAPAAAAALAGVTLTLSALVSAARAAAAAGDFQVCEAAGGLLSPYSATMTGADLAAALGLPVLLVSRNSLGTINHTALALGEIRRRNLPFMGILLVDTTADAKPDREQNAALIEALTGVAPLGVLPFQRSLDPDALADALVAHVAVERLFSEI